jgi:class 3 adenylate cyclase
MTAATIIFNDIVGFSKKATDEQKNLVNLLTVEIIHEIRYLLKPPNCNPCVLALPTGDGVALAFLHNTVQQWNISTVLKMIYRLQKWAFHEGIALRTGIHVGPVEIINDINGRQNICGSTINYAQRVMDAANPKQILISEQAYRHHIGVGQACNYNEKANFKFEGPIDVFAKHDERITVYKVLIESEEKGLLSTSDPVSKDLILIKLTPLPKEVIGSFSERLEKATEISFIQLTGDRFLQKYEEGKIKFSEKLKRFWVFMPDPMIYSKLVFQKPNVSHEFLQKCIEDWKLFFEDFKKTYPRIDLKLSLFKEPPFFGASYLDWERPGGFIHISPYIWNIEAKDCPGFDILWKGDKPSEIYERYVEGLRYLASSTINILCKDD